MNSVQVRAGGVSIEISPRTITLAIDGPEAPRIETSRVAELFNSAAVAAAVETASSPVVEGTVTDSATGLMWSQDDVVGECTTQANAEQACRDLRLGGFDDWRLPTIHELLTLVDYSRCKPAIDVTRFPRCKSDWYWTSTPYASSSLFAWIVHFNSGSACDVRRDSSYAFARAVRSVAPGQ
jgi:hypothetical protein